MNDSLERMSMEAGLTSVVVVTADSGFGVEECIDRVLQGTARVEVIVVDNDSRDGSIEHLAACFAQVPTIRIFRNKKNIGFGAACNRGVSEACGDAVLLLNPDCMIERDTIARLRGALDADPRIGLAGALQVDASGRIDPASRRYDPLLVRALASASGLSHFSERWPRLVGVNAPVSANEQAIETVDAVSGALMLLPRDVFDDIGGFDEGYFLHCEDLDLCRRVRDAGRRVVCANEVRVVHSKGGSSQRRPVFVAWHKHRGMWRWFSKFDPAARNPLLRILVWSAIWTAFALKAPLLSLHRARALQ